MHRRILVALLALTSIALIAGCGDGGGDASADQATTQADQAASADDRDTSAEQAIVSAALIQAKDLPSKTKVEEGLPNTPCNPLEVLESDESVAAESLLFTAAQVRIQEAVGVFAERPSAVAAYDALNAKSRLECIQDAIELQGVPAEILPPHQLGVGDDAQSVHFKTFDPETGQKSSVEIASIRSGRLVASLIFLSTTPKPADAIVDDVVDIAADLLAREQ